MKTLLSYMARRIWFALTDAWPEPERTIARNPRKYLRDARN